MHVLRESYENTLWQLKTLIEGIPQLVWRSCDLGNWTWSSPQWMSFTGQSQDESLGLGWMETLHPDDRALVSKAWIEARPHGEMDVEFRVRRASDGAYVWHRSRSAPALDEKGRIVEWLGTTTDIQDLKMLQERQALLLAEMQQHADELKAEIQERKRTEDKLSYTAFHDDLTKLHNRAFFTGQLKRILSRPTSDPARRGAVLILDLDRFKQVNDSMGHAAGDMLLTMLGRRLRTCIGEEDTLARLGGDEFGLILESLDPAELPDLVARVQKVVRRPVRFGRREIVSSCSLGFTWITAAHTTPDTALQEADIAMYEAKRGGRGGFRAFAEPMRVSVSRISNLRNDLRDAITNAELELHYQPILATSTREITGFEALLRWQHPHLGLLLPGEFIPLAEEAGLIRPIGRWVLQHGCAQLARWRVQFSDKRLTLNVNVCGDDLNDPAFVAAVQGTLAETGIQASCLELEITEGVLLEQSATVLDTMSALREAGVRIAIDDFGTGYSSLSYLDRYDVDTVKIDRSFVNRMVTERRTRAILEAIIGLARTLSLRIVAEGVESADELDLLRVLQCEAVQGYLLGRPCPADGATGMLERG